MIASTGAIRLACGFMILALGGGNVALAAGEAIHVPPEPATSMTSSPAMLGAIELGAHNKREVIAALPVGETAKAWLHAWPSSISEGYLQDNGKLEAIDRVTRHKTLLSRHGQLLFDLLRVDVFGQNMEKVLTSIATLGHCSGLDTCLRTLSINPVTSMRYKGGEAELHVLAQLRREGRLVSLPATLFRQGPSHNRSIAPWGTLFEVDGFIRDENDYQFLEIKAVGYDPSHVEKNLAKALRNASRLGMAGLLIFSLIDRSSIDEHLVRLRTFIEEKLGNSSPLRVAYYHHPKGYVNGGSGQREIQLLYEPEEVVVPTVTGEYADNPAVRALYMLKQPKIRARGLSRNMRTTLWAEEKGLFSRAPKMGKGH